MSDLSTSRHSFSSERHTTSYLSAGPTDGPVVICVHGWPELSISWRHQLPFFAGLGFRAIAPDMRGYGESSVYAEHEAYELKEVVKDMLELLEHLGVSEAIWLGHDWGAPVVWSMASQHGSVCRGVANLCVPYATLEKGLDAFIPLVDREIYPESEFPAGQWEYMRFYEENFEQATKPMDANPRTFCQAIFRKGDPAGKGQPSATSMVRKTGGWMGGLSEAPELPRDADVLSQEELDQYVAGLERNGFSSANAWYMNHERNAAYAKPEGQDVLDLPVLFIHARFDFTCETLQSDLAKPMRALCRDLTEEVIDSGHWMAQEKPAELNEVLNRWLAKNGFLNG